MTEDEITLFHDSFERCMSRPEFFDIFYEHFLGSSGEVASKFSHTDFKKQKKALKASLYATVLAIVRREQDLSCLADVAEQHSRRQLDISVSLYHLWLDSLLHAVERCDARFDAEVDAVWRKAMKPAVDYMIATY